MSDSYAYASRRAYAARLKRAESIGVTEGRRNCHSSVYHFETGEEWILWLKGWRKGQQFADRNSQLSAGAGRR